jgi:hypothetical protein
MRRHQRQAAASPEAQRASAQAIAGARAVVGSLPRGVTPNEPGRRTNFTWQNVLDTITALQAVRETPVLVWANPSVVFDVSDNTMATRCSQQGCQFLRNSRMVIDSVGVITIEEVLSGLDDRYQVARATSQTWQQCLDVINALKAMNQVPVLVWANPSVVFDVTDNTMSNRSQAQGCLFLRNNRMTIDSTAVVSIEEVTLEYVGPVLRRVSPLRQREL